MKRTIQVMVGSVSSKTVAIENVIPQGNVISPVLFHIMINNIFDKVERGFGLSLFADDGAIWKRVSIGSPLEKVKVFTFLGVSFEECMTCAVHGDKIVLKCEKVLNVMRSLAGCDCGAKRETMLLIFQAMIRSALDYGLLCVWICFQNCSN